jgi:signal transduction histidine kinase
MKRPGHSARNGGHVRAISIRRVAETVERLCRRIRTYLVGLANHPLTLFWVSPPTGQATRSIWRFSMANWSRDPHRIHQVLNNLVLNALKYGAGDAPVSVMIIGTPEEVEFSVHNRARMIDRSALQHIFAPLGAGITPTLTHSHPMNTSKWPKKRTPAGQWRRTPIRANP